MPIAAHANHLSLYEYTVFRDGDAIGNHRVRVFQRRAGVEIQVQTDFRIHLGFIPLYRFEHERREIWHGGQLRESIAKTNKNGTNYDIKILREFSGYKRVINGRVDNFGDPVKVLALWHQNLLKHTEFISPMDDKTYSISVEFLGNQMIELGDQSVSSLYYRMTGDSERDLWFDTAGHVLKVRIHDHSPAIEYVLNPPSGQPVSVRTERMSNR